MKTFAYFLLVVWVLSGALIGLKSLLTGDTNLNLSDLYIVLGVVVGLLIFIISPRLFFTIVSSVCVGVNIIGFGFIFLVLVLSFLGREKK